MKVWISKSALNGGIFQTEAREGPGISKDYIFVGGKECGIASFKLGKTAHKTREEAVAAAEKMRVRRIASLRKQIEKLEVMTFGGEE